MIQRIDCEELQLRVGYEVLTLVIPKHKLSQITDKVSKLDLSANGSLSEIERILLKCNGFIRE